MLRNRFETLAHLARSLILKYLNISRTISSGRTLNPPWLFLCMFLQMFPISRIFHVSFYNCTTLYCKYANRWCINSWYYHQLSCEVGFSQIFLLSFARTHYISVSVKRLRESISNVPISRRVEIKTRADRTSVKFLSFGKIRNVK